MMMTLTSARMMTMLFTTAKTMTVVVKPWFLTSRPVASGYVTMVVALLL